MKRRFNCLLVMLVVFATMVVSGCEDDNASKGNGINGAANEVVMESQREDYRRDITHLDGIKTAVATFVADGSSDYEDEHVYTLTELIEIDEVDIIKKVLSEIFDFNTKSKGTFNAKSKVFEGVTSDDVLICIESGAISIYVSVNEGYEDYYNSYSVGTSEKLNKK